MITWPEKDPAEAFAVTFNFAGEMDPDETISAVAMSVTVVSGADAAPAAVLSGPAQVQRDRVLQSVVGGVQGATYGLKCAATMSTGKVRVRAAKLPVMDALRW